ncbi:carbonic anhydrase [Roridomyces roridus]|uniref:Carbonic anhydrase n=1 Tax=Roridomyces roridus TaxID=1738132 RepID=A0AAD7FRF4_9AGAR|nr:carbonic anhydrase [Roridomyces roridus]
MATDKVQDLINQNVAYAKADYTPPPLNFSLLRTLPRGAMTVIISCFDPRAIPEQYFGLKPGQQIPPVIRVAGGRAKDTLKSLLIAEYAFGLGDVVIVHHTDCGMTHMTDAGVKQFFKEQCPHKAAELDAMHFDEIVDGDLKKSVEADVEFLKGSGYFSKELRVTGMIFDLDTGRVQRIN